MAATASAVPSPQTIRYDRDPAIVANLSQGFVPAARPRSRQRTQASNIYASYEHQNIWENSRMPKPTHDDERKGRPSTSSGRALMVSLSTHAVFAGLAFFVSVSANAQTPPLTTSLPPITVTAQKEPQDPANLPVSVTAVLSDTLTAAGLSSVSQAGWFAPNTFFNEFTARKLSNPRFRGVGSSPNNPGITSYIDGVPQLNANSSSIEFLDVEQVEFVRGPQSALFGRNALGGIINITRARRRLRAQRPRVASREAVSRGSRRRRLHPSRHRLAHGPGVVRRTVDRVLDDDRLPELEDAGFHRSRLHAAAAAHAEQRRKGFSVHRRSARRVGENRADRARPSRDAEVAGGRLRVHAELRSGRRQQFLAVRAVAVPQPSHQPALAPIGSRRPRPRRLRSGHVHLRQQARSRRRREGRPRAQESESEYVLHAGDRAAERRQRGKGLF